MTFSRHQTIELFIPETLSSDSPNSLLQCLLKIYEAIKYSLGIKLVGSNWGAVFHIKPTDLMGSNLLKESLNDAGNLEITYQKEIRTF